MTGNQLNDNDPVPLSGDLCVQLVHAVPEAGLPAYSAFLGTLLREELQVLPRGVLHTALRKAEMESVQETRLKNTLTRLKNEAYNTWTKAARTMPTSRDETLATKTRLLAFFSECKQVRLV